MLINMMVLAGLMMPNKVNEVTMPTLPVCVEENYYDLNLEILTKEHVEEVQEEIQRREELAKQQAEELARRIAEEQEQQRIESVTFDPYDVSKPSNLTGEEMYSLLKDTGLKDVAYTYIEAENQFGVNAFFLAGLSALESGWGTSERSVRDNNLTGYNIRSSSDIYKFSSRSESLMKTAQLISVDYLTENGRYYLGKSVWNINKHYCPPIDGEEKSWGEKIITIANRLYNEYRDLKQV